MKNYKLNISRPVWFLLLLFLCVLVNSCIAPKPFDTGYLFYDPFYGYSMSEPGTTLNDSLNEAVVTPFYLGFNQNYVLNNNVFVSGMTRPGYRKSQIGYATAEVEKYTQNVPPKDSQEIFILRLRKNFYNKEYSLPYNYMFDTPNVYYLFASLKYSQFKNGKDSPRVYKVSGFGRVYLGTEDTATGNLLFFQELKIRHFHNPQIKSPGKNDYKLARLGKCASSKKGDVLLLFESRLNKKKNSNNAISEFSEKDSTEIVHLYEVPKDSILNFSYIIVGNTNQIGGRKYLDISVDSAFHYEALKFGPYPPLVKPR